MNYLLLFEISDKIMNPKDMYVIFLTFGIIGILLGLWRWWASLIWLIPTLLYSALFIWLQIDEIDYLYENIIREFGESYIWHNYISVGVGILLNIFGLFIKKVTSRRIILR